jgi:hypothetical protein
MKESDLRNPKFLEELFNAPWPRWKSMKESDWAACNDPSDMVRFLSDSGKLSDRKARLFAVACCFHCFWYRLVDDHRIQIAAGLAARHAEGLAEAQEVMEAAASARAVAETVQSEMTRTLQTFRPAGRSSCTTMPARRKLPPRS